MERTVRITFDEYTELLKFKREILENKSFWMEKGLWNSACYHFSGESEAIAQLKEGNEKFLKEIKQFQYEMSKKTVRQFRKWRKSFIFQMF